MTVDIEIYGLANSFQVPAKSVLTFAAENNTNVYQMTKFQHSRGIFASPTFADPNAPPQSENEFLIPQNTTMTFTIKMLDLSSDATLTFKSLLGEEIQK